MLGGPGGGGGGAEGGGYSRDRGERSGGAPRGPAPATSRPTQKPTDTFEDDDIPF